MIVAGALISQLFQAPIHLDKDLNTHYNPFLELNLGEVRALELTNKLGRYKIHKKQNYWYLSYPKNLPADTIMVRNILSVFSDIKIRASYQNDEINRGHFSLDRPSVKLTLEFNDEKREEINVGVINPIDNSMYIAQKGQEAIYQTELLDFPLESLEFSSLIDPYVFSPKEDDVSLISIKKAGKSFSNPNILTILKDKETNKWLDEEGQELDSTMVSSYLNKLLHMKRTVIIDEKNKTVDELTNQYLLKQPAFIVELKDNQETSFIYTISGLIYKAVPRFKITKLSSFLVQASDREYPYVVLKKELSTFNITSKQLRKR